jgi:uncharacterized membrane protein YphA (DoxX/SURF4 family)
VGNAAPDILGENRGGDNLFSASIVAVDLYTGSPVSIRGLATLLGRGLEMTDFDNRINVGWWALRIGLGVGPIITGIDKYFNKLTDWGMYLSPLVTKVLPVSATTFMHVVGVVEIIAGLIVLSRWTKLGSYIVMLWLLGIAVNLLATGIFYDLAMRDVEIAIGAFALSQLSAVREQLARAKQAAQGAPSSQSAVIR